MPPRSQTKVIPQANGKQAPATTKGRPGPKPKKVNQPTPSVPIPTTPVVLTEAQRINKLCNELVTLQRERQVAMKSRIMQDNRLRAIVARKLGYTNELAEKDRETKFTEAADLIKSVVEDGVEHPLGRLIKNTVLGIKGLMELEEYLESEMINTVKQLPLAKGKDCFLNQPAQRGFGAISLAKIIGECGNLSNYANPAKVWRRMGCAPYTYNGETKMGSTWMKKGGLSANQWHEFGYNPGRRAIAHVISEGLVKQNGTGPYRKRYDKVKAECYTKHPDWTWSDCTECKGSGKAEEGKPEACAKCYGSGQKCGRAHTHAMLVAVKLLMKKLWQEWHKVCGSNPTLLPLRQPHPDDTDCK